MNNSGKTYLLLPLVILIGVLLLVLARYSTSDSKVVSKSSQSLTREKIVEDIKKLGPQQVFDGIKNENKEKDIGDAHFTMHIFGEELYKAKGIDGFYLCDSSFGFGCYHGFFLRAISSEGIGVLAKADKECIEKFGMGGLGCPHGIGHGVLEYYGSKRLTEALKACSTLSWKGKLFGCQDGVFMEYNFPTTISSEDESSVSEGRVFNPRDPYFPCNSVPLNNTNSCFFNLAGWLLSVNNESFEKVGKLCYGIESDESEKFCFLGLGQASAERSGFDPEATQEKCSVMPDLKSQVHCLSGAAWSFYSQKTTDSSEILCRDLDNLEKTECINGSRLFEHYRQ